MEDLILYASVLFDERAPAMASPPLPPAPLGQSAPNYAYGSAHTRVASVPAPLTTPRQPPQPQPEDFTPRLPPRPANSIHPSSRANPSTPTRNNFDIPTPLLPGRPSQTQSAKPERPSAVIPQIDKAPTAAESEPPSPSVSSSFGGEEDIGPEEHHDAATSDDLVHEPVPPSPTKKIPQTPKSTAPVLPPPVVPNREQGQDNGASLAPSPSVPGGLLS